MRYTRNKVHTENVNQNIGEKRESMSNQVKEKMKESDVNVN